jgi:hypothetical protein
MHAHRAPSTGRLLASAIMILSIAAITSVAESKEADCTQEEHAVARDTLISVVDVAVAAGIKAAKATNPPGAALMATFAPRLIEPLVDQYIAMRTPAGVCKTLGKPLLPVARALTGASPYVKGTLKQVGKNLKVLLENKMLKEFAQRVSEGLLKRKVVQALGKISGEGENYQFGDITKGVLADLSLADYKFGDVTRGIISKLAGKDAGDDYKFGDISRRMWGALQGGEAPGSTKEEV